MNPVIETDHLSFSYFRRADVLRDVTFQVGSGSFYALIGRNGAGKSTLLKILAGGLVPRQGSSRLLGTDSLKLGVAEWQQIGFVSEAQPLYPGWKGEELLRFTRSLYPNWDHAFCQSLIRSLELPLDRKIGAYSKGERMKFILLLAMAFHPRLLLLDEPFSGLDVVAKEQLIACLLEATGQEQWAVICASHDIAEIERLADGIGILDHGALTVNEQLEDLQNRFRRVQVYGAMPVEAANFDASMLQPKQSESGLTFVESAYNPEREASLRQRFGPNMEIQPLPLRDILFTLFTANGAQP